MNLKLSLPFFLLTMVSAFQPAPRNFISTELKAIKNPMGDILRKITNNFTPVKGHGSLEADLEEQWEAQQELLKERKRKNIDKEHLKQKYKDPEARKSFNQNVGLPDKNISSEKKNFWDKNVSPWDLLSNENYAMEDNSTDVHNSLNSIM